MQLMYKAKHTLLSSLTNSDMKMFLQYISFTHVSSFISFQSFSLYTGQVLLTNTSRLHIIWLQNSWEIKITIKCVSNCFHNEIMNWY